MKTNHFSRKLLIVCALLFLSFGADAQSGNSGSAKDAQKKEADLDLSGTYWACTTNLEGLEKINFRLLRGGGIRYQSMVIEDSKEELIENGRWETTGSEVRLYIKYSTQAIWRGTLAGDRIDGNASNDDGDKWKFSCRKSSTDVDLAGTYWACTTNLKGLEKINFRLLRGGRIRYQSMVIEDSEEELIENGRWETTGSEVRLYIKYSSQAIWSGTLVNDRIDGAASNEAGVKWKFSCRKS